MTVSVFEPIPAEESPWRRSDELARLHFDSSRSPDAATANQPTPIVRRSLVGETPAMTRLRSQIARIGPKNVTVLIEGETGTGKELVARAIHEHSPRHDRAFVAVNCAELSGDTAESRLFGHRKGSFTGAIDSHMGFFQVADRGTLFLDEVGELALPIQAKLLRVLQEGEIVRFGDSKPRSVDVRFVAATNRCLEKEVEAGRFREDLLYRLKVIPLHVPPLRERLDDVPLLAEHFVALHAPRLGVPALRLSADALRALRAYGFPGNVRELEHVIVRAMVLCESGEVTPADLNELAMSEAAALGTDAVATHDDAARLPVAVARYERRLIERALEASGGNRARAARELGISRRWLLKRLEHYHRSANEH